MRPRVILMLVVALIVIVVGGRWLFSRARPAPASPQGAAAATPASATSAQASSQARLLDDLITKGVTPDRAKQYFSLAVAPLPGVSIDGMTHDPTDFDGTEAVYYLRQVWSSLTPDQQKAAHDVMVGTGGRISTRTTKMGDAFGSPRMLLAGFGRPADEPAHDYANLEWNADKAIATALGVDEVKLTIVTVMDTASEFAHSQSWPDGSDLPFDDGSCYTIVHNTKFIALDDLSTASIMAHEVMHCFQDRAAGSAKARGHMPQWVADGEATWAQGMIVPSATDVIEKHWTPYLFGPDKPFYFRTYDAVGVFGHASDLTSANGVWSRMLSVAHLAGLAESEDVLKAEIAGFADRYFSSWGASYFRATRDPWQIRGPALSLSTGPKPDKITLGQDEMKVLAAGQYEATLTSVDTTEDILEVVLVQGYGRAHDEGFGLDTKLEPAGPLELCVAAGGCTCPPDTEGKVPATQKASLPIAIGLDGGDDPIGRVGLAARSLSDFCKRKKPKPAPDPGGGTAGGGGGADNDPASHPDAGHSSGDPHLRSFDGVPFDFQHVGEYTLAKSTKDDFTVQVRQIPIMKSRSVAVNQAVATKIGGKRVTITLEDANLVLRLDGAIVSGDPPAMQDGSITRAMNGFGANFTLEWPDGTIVTAGQVSRLALNVGVKPAAVRKGSLEGLLGDSDGTPGNDDVDAASLARKWLVPASASLFDYAPGQTSATFVDPNFPDASETVPNRDAAERACREEGITDATLLHNCVIDFGITNGFLFADQYAQQQAVLTAHLSALAAAAPAAPKEKIVMMAGTITDKSVSTQFTFDAQAGDVLYVHAHAPDCIDRSETSVIYFALFDPGGVMMGGGQPGCDLGRFVLPAAGTYTIKGNMAKNQIGTYRVPLHFLRHDRVQTVKYGDILSGNIEQKGAHDLYTFTANAGDMIQMSGPSCALNSMFTAIIGPGGWDMLGPDCRQGNAKKIEKSGTYTLLVNSGDGGPGTYQFVFQGASGK